MAADLLTGSVSVPRVEDGKMASIDGASTFKPNPIGWTLCEVSFDEEKVLVLVNGKPCLEFMDASGGWAGQAGLWAAPGAFTGFDHFEIGRAGSSAPKMPERRSLRR